MVEIVSDTECQKAWILSEIYSYLAITMSPKVWAQRLALLKFRKKNKNVCLGKRVHSLTPQLGES